MRKHSKKLIILHDFRTFFLFILFHQDAYEVPKDMGGIRLVVEGTSPCKRMEVLKSNMFREG